MKFYAALLCLTTFITAVSAETNQVTIARVIGDRVSLRALPSVSADLLERAMRGDEMVYIEQTNGWVAVQAPDSLSYWVAQEYISGGIVNAEKLNVRSGPSLNYTVVGVLSEGDAVDQRGTFNNWVKIAPPAGCRVWVSEKYVEIVEPPKPELVPLPVGELVVEAEKVEPVKQIVEVVVGEEIVPVVVVEAPSKPALEPLVLVMDKSRPQGTYDEIPGVLRRANPGLYQLILIMDGYEEPICLIRGKEDQMERYLNRAMLIKGKKYWAKGVDLPILQPDKIVIDPILMD